MSEYFDLCQKLNKDQCRTAGYTCTEACAKIWQNESDTNEAANPTLNDLKNLMHEKSEPVKRLNPKMCGCVPEYALETKALRLAQLADENDGRLTLAMARHELSDKSLTLSDVHRILAAAYPRAKIEMRPGNTLLVYVPKFSRGYRKLPP